MRVQSYLAENPWIAALCAVALASACVAEDADADDMMDEVNDGDDGPSSPSPAMPAEEEMTEASEEPSEPSTSGGEGVDCSEITPVEDPVITDFETYDGAAAADVWEFNFNGDEEGIGAIYGGFFPLEDETGDYALEFVDGADGSQWALSARDSAAGSTTDGWGGGFGIWHGCMDASEYTGIQFMMKGSSPAGTGDLTISLPNDETVSVQFDIPSDWELVQLPFSSFVGGSDSPTARTDGSQIGALAFAAHLVWMPSADDPDVWVPEQGPFELTVDDLSFY